jgi:hypothetical protein
MDLDSSPPPRSKWRLPLSATLAPQFHPVDPRLSGSYPVWLKSSRSSVRSARPWPVAKDRHFPQRARDVVVAEVSTHHFPCGQEPSWRCWRTPLSDHVRQFNQSTQGGHLAKSRPEELRRRRMGIEPAWSRYSTTSILKTAGPSTLAPGRRAARRHRTAHHGLHRWPGPI